MWICGIADKNGVEEEDVDEEVDEDVDEVEVGGYQTRKAHFARR